MKPRNIPLALLVALAAACAGSSPTDMDPDGGTEPGTDGGPDMPTLPPGEPDGVFVDRAATARFLTQATFGPRPAELDAFTGGSASAWFRGQLDVEPSLLMPRLTAAREEFGDPEDDFLGEIAIFESPTTGFWRNALAGEDQLRQRMAWALSQILVVSNGGGEILTDIPEAVVHFEDLLIRGAFGNFRDLLTEVTYAPAMGYYLTFLGSAKADPVTGRMPDENYARELLQLFTIGVLELAPDGTPTPRDGRTETYDNRDITGLARVFTGFQLDVASLEEPPERDDFEEFGDYRELWTRPLAIRPRLHSEREKSFLGTTIPANTPGAESVRLALDAIFAHPNVAPFIARQLIQRFVTSDPAPAYVQRVGAAFESGTMTLPDGTSVGSGRRGDLAATLAAVLFDELARSPATRDDPTFGKVREPVLRYSAMVRALEVGEITPEYNGELFNTADRETLAQHPYRAPSVFNFYRPGYVAPQTETGENGMTVPELQLVDATTVPGYANWMLFQLVREPDFVDAEEVPDPAVLEAMRRSLMPDYAAQLPLAEDPAALIAQLNERLTYGSMSAERQAALAETVGQLDTDEPRQRVVLAAWLVLTSPEFLVQR
ncbi:MAG: DUF1800 domain-containing protein [Myxococcota bacterium]